VIGPGIIVPLVILAVVVPVAFVAAKRYLRSMSPGDAAATATGVRLTSGALHRIDPVGWRIVYEIPADALGGIDHVLVGPSGIYAVTTSLDPLPPEPTGQRGAREMAAAAIRRGDLDDVLRRCGSTSDAHVTVHWGAAQPGPCCVELGPGELAVSGHQLDAWFAALGPGRLGPAQVDLAWQTVVTGIGRPDPLR
jgi:hypothetical protein